jgi:hypothetical protein
MQRRVKKSKTNKLERLEYETLNRFLPDHVEATKLEFDTIDRFLIDEKDPRTIAAKRFYGEVPSGIVKLHKTTRAGATVALCSESVRRNELCVMICRTNRNITKTVKGEVVSVLGRPVNVVHIMRNSFCPRIMNLIAKYPAIELLGVIPLPNCDHCDVAPCPIREAFETPVKDVHVYALTYAKLASLMMSRSKRVKELLDKLLRSKNVLFDEVQFLEEGDTVAVSVWEKKGSHEHTLNLDKYNRLAESSPLIQRFLGKAQEALISLQPEVEKLKLKAVEDRHLKHLALPIKTPAYIRALQRQREYDEKRQMERENLQRLHPDKSWIEIEAMMGDSYREAIKEMMKESETLSFSEIVMIQELLIKAITEPGKYGLTEDEIVTLSRLLFIINANVLVVSYVRGLEGEHISIQSENSIMYAALRSFLSKLFYRTMNERRIIFTTATFGTLKIENLLHLPVVSDYIWGDPLNTSSKFLVVADRFRVSPYNFAKRLGSVTALIKAIIEKFGPENVQVCTMNKAWSKRIGFQSTWYGSDLTEGVSSRKRVWVMVGLAEKPVNAKDHLAITQAQYHDNPLNLQGEEFLYYVSQKLRADSVHISSYQAFSRAKDPEGKSRSIVIVIGARKEEVEKCLLWGPARTLKPVKTDKGLKFTVEIQNPIGKPFITVAPLTTDIEESMHIIDQWMTNGRIEEYRLNWHHIKRIVEKRGYASVKRLVGTYRFPLEETQKLFDKLTLPEGYASLRSTDGRVKAIVKADLYEKLTKPINYINTRICADSVQKFESLISAVTKAKPGEVLTSTYFSKHVSANARRMLNEFFDFLTANPLLSWLVVTSKSGKRRLIFDTHCINVWASSFPRRFGIPEQRVVNSAVEVLALINQCLREGLSSYISVYDFREGHPSEGGNPVIDRIYIDLDLESSEFKALMLRLEKGEDVLEEVLRLRRTLLAQVIKEAKRLVEVLARRGIIPRIVLSGFKGVNIFIDFAPVQFSFPELAKTVLSSFTERVAKEADVRVDMSVVGDLSRICRIPNTLHSKASKVLGRPQYCVPITVDELETLTVDQYDALCSAQRLTVVQRFENIDVSREIVRIVKELDPDDFLVNVGRNGYVKDPELVAEYEREARREIFASEDYEELRMRPCFKRVRRESIQLDGSEGHNMRLAAVAEMIANEISIPSIVRWFDFCADFNPDVTRRKVEEIISYGYGRKEINEFGEVVRRPWRCFTIIKKCPSYCLREECPTYRRLFGG